MPHNDLRKRWLAPCTLPFGRDVTNPDGSNASADEVRCMRLLDTDGIG